MVIVEKFNNGWVYKIAGIRSRFVYASKKDALRNGHNMVKYLTSIKQR